MAILRDGVAATKAWAAQSLISSPVVLHFLEGVADHNKITPASYATNTTSTFHRTTSVPTYVIPFSLVNLFLLLFGAAPVISRSQYFL